MDPAHDMRVSPQSASNVRKRSCACDTGVVDVHDRRILGSCDGLLRDRLRPKKKPPSLFSPQQQRALYRSMWESNCNAWTNPFAHIKIKWHGGFDINECVGIIWWQNLHAAYCATSNRSPSKKKSTAPSRASFSLSCHPRLGALTVSTGRGWSLPEKTTIGIL